MAQDEFTKLFKYVEEMRSEMNARFDETATKKQVNDLIKTIDGFIKRLDDMEIENAARDHKIDRLEHWIEQIAKETGVKLSYK